MKLLGTTIGIATLAAVLAAAAALEFEVATIKPNRTANGVQGDCHGSNSNFQADEIGASIPRGRCIIRSGVLRHFLTIAYGIPVTRITSSSELILGNDRFDIEAKAESPSATYEELKIMLQNLLSDRFKLRLRHEIKDIPGYVLSVAKSGVKLKESRNDQDRPSLILRGASINKFDAVNRLNLDLNTITARKISMSRFVDALSNLPNGGPVLDNTGLTGSYDFTVSWEPGESPSTVLQNRLGLRMEPQKIPVEFLIVDHAEMPTEN